MNERRQHCRVSGVMVSDTTVRVRPGHDGVLLNLCPRGALIELRRPVAPGIFIDVQLSRNDTRVVRRALVLRCTVRAIAALDGVTYQAALLFNDLYTAERETDARDGYLVPDEFDALHVIRGSDLPTANEPFRVHEQEPAK